MPDSLRFNLSFEVVPRRISTSKVCQVFGRKVGPIENTYREAGGGGNARPSKCRFTGWQVTPACTIKFRLPESRESAPWRSRGRTMLAGLVKLAPSFSLILTPQFPDFIARPWFTDFRLRPPR